MGPPGVATRVHLPTNLRKRCTVRFTPPPDAPATRKPQPWARLPFERQPPDAPALHPKPGCACWLRPTCQFAGHSNPTPRTAASQQERRSPFVRSFDSPPLPPPQTPRQIPLTDSVYPASAGYAGLLGGLSKGESRMSASCRTLPAGLSSFLRSLPRQQLAPPAGWGNPCAQKPGC